MTLLWRLLRLAGVGGALLGGRQLEGVARMNGCRCDTCVSLLRFLLSRNDRRGLRARMAFARRYVPKPIGELIERARAEFS